MNWKLLSILQLLVESFLFVALIGVLPVAWILRDGLGPDSVASSGLAAISRTFMTFYVGPAILLLASFALLLRSRLKNSVLSGNTFLLPMVIMLILTALGTVSFRVFVEH